MTNMIYVHTFTIGIMDLIMTTIFLVHCHLLKLMGDVVGGSGVGIPVSVNPIGVVHTSHNP